MAASTEDIMGYAVDKRGIGECVDEMVEWITKGDHCRWLACINPHSYVVACKDKTFEKALREADWLIPDGIGIVIASRLLKGEIHKRITGPDIFGLLQVELNRKGGFNVFFLGSMDETLGVIRERMKRDFPNFRVVGTYSPPYKAEFSPADTDAMVAAVNASGADVLWVGMTAPKQEKWIHQNKYRLKVKFAGAIGAVFDFYTGRVKRSHIIFRKLGLEWLPRLIREPRRLWRRMFLSGPVFVWHVLLARFSHSKTRTFDKR